MVTIVGIELISIMSDVLPLSIAFKDVVAAAFAECEILSHEEPTFTVAALGVRPPEVYHYNILLLPMQSDTEKCIFP